MSYKDDEELNPEVDINEDELEEEIITEDDLDDPLLDDDILLEDDLLEDEEDMSDFVGLDGSEY